MRYFCFLFFVWLVGCLILLFRSVGDFFVFLLLLFWCGFFFFLICFAFVFLASMLTADRISERVWIKKTLRAVTNHQEQMASAQEF